MFKKWDVTEVITYMHSFRPRMLPDSNFLTNFTYKYCPPKIHTRKIGRLSRFPGIGRKISNLRIYLENRNGM